MPAKIRRIWTLIRQIRGLERCLQELHEYRRRVIDDVYLFVSKWQGSSGQVWAEQLIMTVCQPSTDAKIPSGVAEIDHTKSIQLPHRN